VLALLVVAAAVLPFLSALRGDFVYDDRSQIVENALVQDPHQLWKALTSDVWAFKGEREGAWSSYWRPLFVLWLAVNERLFGLASTVGWHASLLALHALVALLALRLARALGAPLPLAGGAAVLFAAHPGHVESVAWLSGAPDPLATCFLLLALLALARRVERGGWLPGLPALAAGAMALLAKEFAVVLPLLAAGCVAELGSGPRRERWRRAGIVAAACALPVVAYLGLRHAVIGGAEVVKEWQRGPAIDLLSAPRVLLFYARQSVWPVEVGPSYPLRVATPDQPLLPAVLAPLLLLALVAALLWPLLRRDRLARCGALLWLLPLLPALHVDAFHPEQIVHDRYLYLPLLGAAWVAVAALQRLAAWRMRSRAELATLGVALALAVPLGALAADASRAWTSELALWQRGVRTDPTSALSHLQLGLARRAAGDLSGARAALERAMELGPVEQVRLAHAEILLSSGEPAAAEAELRRLHAARPQDPAPAERLARLLQRTGRSGEAEAIFRAARELAPQRRCSLTTNLAVLLFLEGRRDEAREELRVAAAMVEREPVADCRRSLYLLADLEAAAGRPEAARAALERLDAVLRPLADPASVELRERVGEALRRLGR